MTRKALGRGLSALIREVESLPPVGVARPLGEADQSASGPPAREAADSAGLAGRAEGTELAATVGTAGPAAPARPAGSAGETEAASEAESTGPPALSAPLPPAPDPAAIGASLPAGGLQQIPLALIDRNPFQPRREIPMEKLQELAASIRSTGLLQPVLLRPVARHYEVVAGERRWHAATIAGLDAIPALVRPLSDQETLELALTENLLREDLNALEVARAYSTLQSEFDLTHEEIADRLGLNRTTVTNTIRLLQLSERVQNMVAAGELSAGHARALLALDSAGAQEALAKIIRSRNLSVRATEYMIANRFEQLKKQREAKRIEPNIAHAARELERTLGTRVRITGNGKRGKIEISYFSAEDLNRLYELIAPKAS